MAINYGSLQATLTPRGVVSGKVQNATRAFVKDYDLLDNKPKVNGVELLGDKSLDDLGIEIPEIVANPGDTTENLTSIGIDGVNYNIQGSGGSAVTSVNGKTGDVNLDAEDVGALPDDTPIPSELADLSEDSTHRTVTDTEKQTWDNKSDFSGSYNDLEDKPDIPDELSDLTDDSTHRLVTDTEKTTWNAKSDFSGSYNDLTDKPTLGTAAAKDYATSVIDGSNDLVTGDAVHEAIDNAVSSSYHHAGTKTCAELVSGLLIKANEGNVYNITDSGVTTADFIEGAGKPIEQGANVGVAKIAENSYKFDLLSGVVDTSNFIEKSSTSGLVKNDGSIDTNSYATTSQIPDISGKADKSEMSISTSGDQTTIQLKSGTSATVINQHQDISGKVDKVTGKGLSTNDYDNNAKGIVDGVTSALAGKVDKDGNKVLSTNDYTTAEKTKLAGISEGANKVEESETNGNIVVDGIETQVYDDSEIKGELTTDTTTIEGNPINFSTKSAQNAKSTILSLEPIQDLHGYDKPWVGGAGKNLLPMTVAEIKALNTSATWVGNKYTVSHTTFELHSYDGVYVDYIKVSTDSSGASYNINLTLGTFVGENGTNYIINGCPSGGSGSSYNLSLGSYGSDIGSGKAFTYTTNQSAQIWVVQGTIISNKMFYPMIRLASETDPSFAPYANICPITGRTEIGILGEGKNLVNETLGEYGYFNADGSIHTSSAWKYQYIRIIGGQSYTISNIPTAISDVYLCWFDKAKDFISNSGSYQNGTISAPANAEYLGFCINQNTGIGKNIQVEKDNQATIYEPYTKSNDLTISLGQTVYGGTLDVENGVLVVDKAIQDLGSLNWSASQGTSQYVRMFSSISGIAVPPNNDTLIGMICSCYLEATANETYRGVEGIGTESTGRITVLDKRYTNADDFKSAITGQTLCYPLATPIEIQLTPHQISLLEGVNNISTTGDKITLTYRDGKVATLGDLLEVEQKIPSATAQHNYSTEEQVVGTWIDRKPIYEKSYSLNLPSSFNASGGFLIDNDVSYIDALVNGFGSAVATDGSMVVMGGLSAIPDWFVNIHRNSAGQLILYCYSSATSALCNGKAFITIQYTKTTAQGE